MDEPTSNNLDNAKRGGAVVVLVAAFLMVWEGYAPVAVHERIDPPGVITYCYGRTNYDDPDIRVGEKFTKDQCKQFLAEDLPKYTAPLKRCLTGFDQMGPHRQTAFITASYNLGPSAVCHSKMVRLMNAGDVYGACDAFLDYSFANHKYVKGLNNRRQAEKANCLRED